MATKKVNKTATAEETVVEEATAEETVVEETVVVETKQERKNRRNKELWTEKKTVFIPKVGGSKNPDVYVSVNGVGYQIQRGVAVEVPAPVYEIVQRSLDAEVKAFEYEQESSSN